MTRLRLVLMAVAVGLMLIGPLWIWASTASLSWDQPTDPTITAVNIYRGTGSQCGVVLTTMLQSIAVAASWVDATIPSTWTNVCYEISYSNGLESPHSNQVQKDFTVPPPPAPAAPTNLKLSQWNGSAWQLLASA